MVYIDVDIFKYILDASRFNQSHMYIVHDI